MTLVDVLACPTCRARLQIASDRVRCSRPCGFEMSYRPGLMYSTSREADKYEDAGYVSKYVHYAYGYLARGRGGFGRGDSEGLYRTVLMMAQAELTRSMRFPLGERPALVLDCGCGVGRVGTSLASLLGADVEVTAIDASLRMVQTAHGIARGVGLLEFAADDAGLGVLRLPGQELDNISFAQLSATDVWATGKCDLVIASMLIDRISSPTDVDEALRRLVDAVRPGGLLILSTPLNWDAVETWNKYGLGRDWLLRDLEGCGLSIEEAFDQLIYRERLDPHGAALELPVAVVSGRKAAS